LKKHNPILTNGLRNAEHFHNMKRPYIGPSNVITMCPREFALIHKHKQVTNFPFGTLMNFESGFATEDFYELWIKKYVPQIFQKTSFRILAEQVNIAVDETVYTSARGRTDFIVAPFMVVEDIIDGEPILLELKKMASGRFKNFKRHGHLSEEAALFQLLTYLKALQTAPNLDFPAPTKGAIIGIQLEPPDIWDYFVDVSMDEIDVILAQYEPHLEMVRKVRENPGEFIPDTFYEVDSMQCKGCSVFEHCRPEETKILKTTDLNEKDFSELTALFQAYTVVNDDKKLADKVIKYLKLRIEQILAPYKTKGISFKADDFVFTVEAKAGESETFELDEMRAAHPEIIEKFTWMNPTSRRYHRYKVRKGQEKELAEASQPFIDTIHTALESPNKHVASSN
jgi:hypothetical protein